MSRDGKADGNVSDSLAELDDLEKVRTMIRTCRDASLVREIRDKAKAVQVYQPLRRAALLGDAVKRIVSPKQDPPVLRPVPGTGVGITWVIDRLKVDWLPAASSTRVVNGFRPSATARPPTLNRSRPAWLAWCY